MADNVDFGTPNSNQISKDVHGSDSPIPLSPQWLFPKPGENKSGSAAGENNFTPSSGYGRRPDVLKSMKNDEEMNDIPKKKDVFRPTVLDMDSGRRERWRDEERDTNSSVRRDRWREGDKEQLGDTRKADRWTDNPSARTFGEARRTPSERWNDSGNKDTNHDQRRDSKWNTRWGPDDKETESTRDKWMDSKDADLSVDKGFSHHNHHAKDEMEGDHYRPWRMNAQNRGKVEPPHHQTSTATKQGPAFVYGRGRGENAPPNFSHGWGRVGSGGSSSFPSQSFTTVSERGEIGHGEPSHLKYSRIQLLDVYRKTDMRSWHNMVDTVLPVPSLTQEEALLPLALCASSSDEQIILNGIDKGEIVSSGAPQVTKEGSMGRNTNDFGEFRRTKFGSREDLPVTDDNKVENVGSSRPSESSSYEKRSFMHSYGSDSKMEKEQDPKVSVWRSPSVAGRTNASSLDRREIPADGRSRNFDMGWLQSQKDLNKAQGGGFSDLSHTKEESSQQGGEAAVRRMQSAVPERTLDTGRLPQSSPENLLLYYKDPRGDVQGPFSGSDIIGWFEAGYFGIDLQVRAANAPPDYPFSLLGDVMPHLRAKARPPPGFSGQVQNDIVDGSGNSSFNASGIFHAKSAPVDTRNVEQKRYTHGSGDAENKFLESLMSANMSNRSTSQLERFPSSEGLQGHSVANATGMSSIGAESGDMYLMAKRMMLERQNSLSNTNQFWPGRDGPQLVPNSDAMHDNAALQARLLASVGDNSRQQAHSQNLMSLLQGLPEGSASNLNNNTGGWSTFPVQSGLDPIQEKLGFHHGQNFPPQSAFGIQQPRPQNQNLSSLANILAQKADSSSGMLTPEQLLASGLSQDPQVLNLLQQQQYLLQMQSQVPFQSQQPISLLDQLLLLKQQQLKQEEQQKLLWQQQQLLSQVLSDPNQRLVEQSYGQLQNSALPPVNASVDHKGFHSTNNFQIGSQVPTSTLQDEHISNTLNLRSSVSQDVSHNAGTEASATLLPHQLFGNTPFQKSWGATLPDQIDDFRHKDVDILRQSEAVDKTPLEQTMQDNVRVNEPVLSNDAVVSSSMDHPRKSVAPGSVGNYESEILVPEKSDSLEGAPVEQEQPKEESSVGKEQSNGEVRDVKRASEKKSRKQRSSKAQSTDQAKVASKAPSVGQSKQSDSDFVDIVDVKTHGPGEMSQGAASQDAQHVNQSLPGGGTRSGSEFIDAKVDLRPVGPASQMDTQVHSAQRAWKAAPGLKPKSLLEIQQEEQRKAQTEMEVSDLSTSLNSISLPTPWAGVVANADHKPEAARTDLNAERPEFSKNQQKKKSPLHDLLTDAPSKSTESKIDVTDYNSLPVMSPQLDSNDDNNFIDAKESKKNRKKAAKSKGVVSKVAAPTVSADLSVSSSPSDKGKGSRQVQTEKEVLPAVPSGPSLADFVMWKGEPTNTAPAPAWSTDSGKISRPTSLRDILKEEGKKGASIQHQIPVPTQKSQPSQAPHGNGPLWSLSASSPGKSGSPVQVISRSSSQAKHNGDDDLFWGPLDQPKQDVKQSDFPQLGIQGTSGLKNTSGKGNFEGSLNRQKSVGVRAAERNLSSSPATIQMPPKGKKDSSKPVKRSEAMDFRDWCESESARLIGTKDTSFLEYCLKQSKSEAEILLIQNLGSFDPRHEFIEKFLNYKEMLPADVLEAAFSQNDRPATGFSGTADMNSGKAAGNGNSDNQGNATAAAAAAAASGGGKKKGKKGKKVSPSVLGFNVVSNRIMMGEIQTIED